MSLALLGVSIPLALARQHETAAPTEPDPVPTVAPPRTPFAFPLGRVDTAATGAGGKEAAMNVASDIQSALSAFYDQAFLDPLAWTGDALPDAVWDVFADTLRRRAAQDAEALTLGEAAVDLAALDVTRSSLDVWVLLDPRGRPLAAVADVVLRALGSAKSGEEVRVVNRASFLFRAASGEWLIVGYPSADTTVRTAPPATPSPGASP